MRTSTSKNLIKDISELIADTLDQMGKCSETLLHIAPKSALKQIRKTLKRVQQTKYSRTEIKLLNLIYKGAWVRHLNKDNIHLKLLFQGDCFGMISKLISTGIKSGETTKVELLRWLLAVYFSFVNTAKKSDQQEINKLYGWFSGLNSDVLIECCKCFIASGRWNIIETTPQALLNIFYRNSKKCNLGKITHYYTSKDSERNIPIEDRYIKIYLEVKNLFGIKPATKYENILNEINGKKTKKKIQKLTKF